MKIHKGRELAFKKKKQVIRSVKRNRSSKGKLRCGVTMTGRIEINPKVMLGKPVIRGTRITVELILRKISEGATESDLLDAYPHLKPEDIKAALEYGRSR